MEKSLPVRILLVEDDPDLTALMLINFQRHSAEVTIASDGVEGLCEILKAIKTRPFDMVILDVSMRYVDGYAFLHALRCFEKNEVIKDHTHVVLHTAHPEALENTKLLENLDVSPVDCYLKGHETLRLMEDLNARIH